VDRSHPSVLGLAHVETKAVDFLLNELHPAGVVLPARALGAVQTAVPNPTILGLHDMVCDEIAASMLIEYLISAGLKFRSSGDVRAEHCSRAAESFRIALARMRGHG
jgi:hypothetical protein